MADQARRPGQATPTTARTVPAAAPARHATPPPKPAAHTPPTPLAPSQQRIKVQAIEMGYYDHARRRVGDVFFLEKEADYSKKWMVRVPSATPEHTTGAAAALQKEHDEILSGRTPTGDSDPLASK